MESGKESGQAEDLTEQAKEPNPLDAKKEAVVEQVANLRGEVQQEVIAQAVGSVAPHAKVAAAKEAVKSANDAVEKEIVVEAVRTGATKIVAPIRYWSLMPVRAGSAGSTKARGR